MPQKHPSMPQKHPSQQLPGTAIFEQQVAFLLHTQEDVMSRRVRALVVLLAASFAFGAAACASPTSPQSSLTPHINTCDTAGSDTC